MNPMLWMISVAFVFLALPIQAADKPEEDLAKMQGKWKVIAAVRNAKAAPDEVLAKMTVTIEKGRIIINDGKRDDAAAITLDSAKTPKAINFKSEKETETMHGIYELKGNTLKLCWSKDGGVDRPTDLDATANRRHASLVLERVE